MEDHKTNVRDSSMEAFEALCRAGVFPKQRRKLFMVYAQQGQPLCDYVLAQLAGCRLNAITQSRNDLLSMEYIVDCGKLPAPPSNKSVYHYKINPECLKPGWKPKPLNRKKKTKPKRIEASVSNAGRVLRAARDKKRQRAVMVALLPLFDTIL